ncbi:UDP-3-O-acyl-N-acetylglucosamine deacetylase [Methylophilaceae bacterium]|jgi:UDP-3-O-[3-hydroxymyristoyl] N-acetylglucosamine deacetylase|nr:UDP-3-O-acyl-N-acetylglucosamine deacetylase [Methylophilaceae bacterium]
MILQRTIKNSVSTRGVGLHTGEKVTLTLHPANEDQGIVFTRSDLETPIKIQVSPFMVTETKLCSTIGVDQFKVSTVEHIMSALSASGIDNIVIDVNGSEVPIMDGSSIAFIHLIKSAIIKEQKKPKKFVVINELIEVKDEDRLAKFEPHQGFVIDFMIDFPHPAFNDEDSHVSIDFFKDSYIKGISRARTFGFMQEVEYLRTNGLARGGSLDNAIVLDEYKILNEDGLRYSDEFVRHKILDAVGDLYMLGSPIIGKFTAYKSGHELNNKLLRALVENPQSWSLENLDNNNIEMAELAKNYLLIANEFSNKRIDKIQ